MKIIVYKKRGDFYECTSLKDTNENESTIIFDEPISGKVKFGKAILTVTGGACRFNAAAFADGVYSPVLIKNKRLYKMEDLTLKSGGVERKTLGEEYLRSLSERIEEGRVRLQRLEEKLKEISEKIERKITF